MESEIYKQCDNCKKGFRLLFNLTSDDEKQLWCPKCVLHLLHPVIVRECC